MRPSFFYVAYLICCAGVNGSSTHAVKALAGALAERDGYGRGEFSYATNHYLSAICVASRSSSGSGCVSSDDLPDLARAGAGS